MLWVPVLLQVCGGVCWMAPIWTEVGGTAEVSLPFTAAAALTNLEVSRVGGPPSSHGSRRRSGVHNFALLTKRTKGLVDSGGYDVRDSAAASSGDSSWCLMPRLRLAERGLEVSPICLTYHFPGLLLQCCASQ